MFSLYEILRVARVIHGHWEAEQWYTFFSFTSWFCLGRDVEITFGVQVRSVNFVNIHCWFGDIKLFISFHAFLFLCALKANDKPLEALLKEKTHWKLYFAMYIDGNLFSTINFLFH